MLNKRTLPHARSRTQRCRLARSIAPHLCPRRLFSPADHSGARQLHRTHRPRTHTRDALLSLTSFARTSLGRRSQASSTVPHDARWADINKVQLETLAKQLTQAVFNVQGKSTFKEEFVTAGGVSLKEINFKTFESKRLPGLYFAGEVLDIDAITGGFNFQNAWTGAHIVSQNIAKGLV